MIDTGGGKYPTMTKRACEVLETSGQTTELLPYGSAGPARLCNIANVVIKAHFPHRDLPVLFVLNHVNLLDDPNENESLAVPFNFWAHGIRCCLKPPEHGGTCGMVVDGETFPFQWDKEKLYLNISKPTHSDLSTLEWFELTLPNPDLAERIRRKRQTQTETPGDIPIAEWRRRLAMIPEDVVRKTLANTTHFYLNPAIDTRQDPRRELLSHRPGLRLKRRNEVVGTDTFFPSVKTAQGHTCSQLFVGQNSRRWDVFPLKTESQNYRALQDVSRTQGVANVIRSDNAASEMDKEWTDFCRTYCTEQQTTLPHSPWMNFAERNIGTLGAMVRNCHRAFKIPYKYHNWTQRWCCDCHNISSIRKLDWNSPNDIHLGYTQDISKFRFHVWEPIWYYEKGGKTPVDTWKKGRWMGFAHQSGDAFTYYIRTEKLGTSRDVILIRRDIKTRRKNIGVDTEYVNDDIDNADFVLLHRTEPPTTGELMTEDDDDSLPDSPITGESLNEINDHPIPDSTITGESLTEANDPVTTAQPEHASTQEGENDPATLYPGENPIIDELNDEDLDDIYNQFQIEDDESDFEFEKIVDHQWKDGVLHFNARFQGTTDDGQLMLVSFPVLKADVPLGCAKYIKNYVIDSSARGSGIHTEWANKVLKQHGRTTRRLTRIYNIGASYRYDRNRRAKLNRHTAQLASLATNGVKLPKKKTKTRPTEKQGIPIPGSIRQALVHDRKAVGTPLEGKWATAVTKEMDGLERLCVFDYHPPNTRFNRKDGWQFAPMHMIFDIKADGRYKARLCVGGNVLDCSAHTTYSSTIQDVSVRLLMVIAAQNGLHMMTADVANAFCTAPNVEKVWSIAGKEFGDKEGAKVTLKRALYGTRTASRSFHEFLGELFRRMGFQPSRADQDLWWRKSDDYEGYDYLATHVDDIICVSKDPSVYMAQIEQEFKLRDLTDNPSYYLGNDLKRLPNGRYHISSTTYTKEMIRKYQADYQPVRKETSPMEAKYHPEFDESPLLLDDGTREYQRIIGTCQWLIVAGRFDLCYAVSSLSRFSSAPRQGHLQHARRIMGYLRKFPRRGFVINPDPPRFHPIYQNVEVKPPDFGNQYDYFHEDINARFPPPLLDKLDLNLFVDADHGHDLSTGRSITGTLVMVGCTPVVWRSRRQTSVQTSTFGSEFTSLKAGVEEAVTLRYHLRSLGVKVSKPTPIWVDNMAVVLNSTKPGSALNKKVIALAYHFVREHQSRSVISIRKIDTKDNYADPFTKALNNISFHAFFIHLLHN